MCKFIIACLISLSALSFSSCTQKKVATSVAYMDFPQTIELKARVQPLDTALFRYPFRVRVQGDKAVVMDLPCFPLSGFPLFGFVRQAGRGSRRDAFC